MKAIEKKLTIEGAPNVTLRRGAGRWKAVLEYSRELRNGNLEFTELVFTDVTVSDLRCIARSLRGALDDMADEWRELKTTLEGKS